MKRRVTARVAAGLALSVALLAGCSSNQSDPPKTVAERNAEAFGRKTLAAEQGDVKAQTELGTAYWGGMGVPRNAPEAVRWWQRAASGGECRAMLFLGNAYETGEGVGVNLEAAMRWYKASAEQGNTTAMISLSQLQVERAARKNDTDFVEVYKWYEILAVVDPFPDLDVRREALASMMSPSDVQSARKLAAAWLQGHRAQLESGPCAKSRRTRK